MTLLNRPRRSLLLSGGVAVLLASSLVGCGSDGDTDGSAQGRLRTTISPGLGSLPFRVAQEQGYFESCGVQVEATEGFDIPSYMASLGRQFDSVMLIPSLSVPAASAGLDLKAFGGMEAVDAVSTPNPVITNRPDINSIEDLAKAGGRLGVIASGDNFAAYFTTLFKGTDLDPSAIQQVSVPFADMPDQLDAGRIDAFVGALGSFEFLLDDPSYRVIANFPGDVVEAAGVHTPTTWPHFVTTGAYASDNMDSLKCFRDSIQRASEWIDDNEEDAFAVYAAWLGVDPEQTANIKMPHWQDVNPETYDAWQTIYANADMLEGPVDPSSIVLDFN